MVIIKNKSLISTIILTLTGTLIGISIALIVFIIFIGDLSLLSTYIFKDSVIFRSGNGDILFWQSEYIRPLENPNEILSVHRLRLDEYGFRLPARVSNDYDVVALGDSYTEGANVARPWSDAFASESSLSTRNLGFRGYGIRHYAWTWQEFGIQENPDVLIIGFFGGNDIFTAGLDIESPFPLPIEKRANDIDAEPVTVHTELDDEPIYPIYLSDSTSITFLSTYISWMNAAEDQLRGSVNYQVISEGLTQIQETASDDTCLVFVYFPSKVEVYFPYLDEADYPTILEGQKTVLLNSDGTLHIVEDFDISLERVMDWRLNTGNVMTELAETIGYNTLNLHSAFDEHAGNGEMLYYTYDTHWNQAGQMLAGETIADFVTSNCENL